MTTTTLPAPRPLVHRTERSRSITRAGRRSAVAAPVSTWRRLAGRAAATLRAVSASQSTPSEQAMSGLSPVDRPR